MHSCPALIYLCLTKSVLWLAKLGSMTTQLWNSQAIFCSLPQTFMKVKLYKINLINLRLKWNCWFQFIPISYKPGPTNHQVVYLRGFIKKRRKSALVLFGSMLTAWQNEVYSYAGKNILANNLVPGDGQININVNK